MADRADGRFTELVSSFSQLYFAAFQPLGHISKQVLISFIDLVYRGLLHEVLWLAMISMKIHFSL